MKRLSFFIFLLISLCFISAKKTNAQEPRIDPCPPGYCSNGVTFVVDHFSFHKPRTNCRSGFGICLKGHWEAHCVPCWSKGQTNYDDEKVTGWFKISKSKLELHLPLALGQSKQFINENMSIFYLDDDFIMILNEDGSKNCRLKGGEYTVAISGNDYVILIDII